MAIMNEMNAAIIADGTYALTPAHTKADAKRRAKRAAQFTKDSPMLKHPLKVDVDVQQAVVASSGAIVRETTGFGVLPELKRGFDREFILAIRDTQAGYEWLSNITIGATRGPTGALVHSGFPKIYNSMADDVRHLIKDADPRTIHFVCHSLGGALATLASLDYAKAGTADRYLYTFGAPRVGGSAMGQDLERMIGQQRIKRVYNLSDPVPLIPLCPYMHAGPGTIRLSDNFRRVTLDAHSMSGFYIPNMPAQG
ncbi:MAG: lipase family protein [Rhodobacteraceae bacterium]|nr:lipase family protein [Paracoccaceae bacterium]